MKKLIVIGLVLLLSTGAYAKKVNVCYNDDGTITGMGHGFKNGKHCVEVNKFDKKLIKGKKYIGGKFVADVNYNKHLSISSDTNVLETDAWYAMSMFTDIKTILTVKLLDDKNKVVTTDDRVISIKSTGGNLESMSITIVNGVGTVEFLAPTETKEVGITVWDSSGLYKGDGYIIQVVP